MMAKVDRARALVIEEFFLRASPPPALRIRLARRSEQISRGFHLMTKLLFSDLRLRRQVVSHREKQLRLFFAPFQRGILHWPLIKAVHNKFCFQPNRSQQ